LNSLARRAFSGAKATLIWQAIRVALLVVSIVVLARLLAPADFGLLAMVTAIIGIGELVRDFGLSAAVLQTKTLTCAEKSNLFWINSFVGFALGLIVFASSWPIGGLYGDTRLVAITQALSITFVLNGIATQFKAQINRDLRFGTLGATEAIPQAVGLSASIVIAAVTHSYWALVAQTLIATASGALLCVLFARWWPGRYQRAVPVSRFVRFGGALVGTQGLAYLSKNIDSVLLGVIRGPVELGVYSRAYQIVVLPLTQVTTPLSRVAIPVLSRLQDDDKSMMAYLRSAQFATVLTTTAFYGTIIGFGEPLVLLILGDQWIDAVPILRILAVSGIFRALAQVPYWVFVTRGHTGKQLLVYLVGQPLIISSIAIGAVWGGVGVATGCSVGYGLFWVLNMWWAGRVAGLPMGRLATSGLAVVAVFGLPVVLMGGAAVHTYGPDGSALAMGGIPSVLWIVGATLGIPRFRIEMARFLRLARNRRPR
jgi:O-antigen/teichoic acid export membrane protein